MIHASALQSLLLLRSPQDLYRTVRFNDPYKHESWTLLDAQNTLDQWRNGLKHLLIVHNKAISGSRSWQYYGFTDNSLRDLLTQSTVSVWFAQLAGAVVLVVSSRSRPPIDFFTCHCHFHTHYRLGVLTRQYFAPCIRRQGRGNGASWL